MKEREDHRRLTSRVQPSRECAGKWEGPFQKSRRYKGQVDLINDCQGLKKVPDTISLALQRHL